jgi:hypothetical protein
MAQFTVTINAQINLPPSTVGDGATSTDYGVSIVFSRADFTTNTSPAYVDPEGDAALNLKIISLPTEGVLEFNSVAVSLNDIISFTDIDSGLFTYSPDNAASGTYVDPFDFEIADAGSGTFVG